MSEADKDLVRRLFAATDRKDIEGLRAIYAGEFNLNGQPASFDDFAAEFPAFFAAFPDATGHVEELVAEGGRVAARWTTAATHLGEYAGAPASGQRVTWGGVNVYRIEGGRVVEMWQSADTLGLLRQIGAVTLDAGQRRRQAPSHSTHIAFRVADSGKNGSP